LRTPALFSATNINAPLHPPCPMAAKALEDGGFRAVPALNTDPPAHTRVRKLADIAFTPKRVAEMEGFVRDLVIRFCTERLRDGRADIVRDLAWELPALVLFRILSVPDHGKRASSAVKTEALHEVGKRPAARFAFDLH
jgi:cytochrome P450